MKKEKNTLKTVYTPTPLEEASVYLLQETNQTKKRLEASYIQMIDHPESEEVAQSIENELHSLKKTSSNARKVYQQTVAMEDELGARWRDVSKSKKKKFIPAPPSNAAIDLKEKQMRHFAQGINVYKLLLLCFAGSFAGVIVEMLWCLARYGLLDSRRGLVYGPFNLLYGAGAVALTAALYKFRNRGNWLSFFGGMLVGSVLEYICSWGQETILGSRSWDYSNMPFNLNGRICLLYSIFWGILSVAWIKNIYPRVAKWILRIPNRIGKIFTIAFTVFFVFDIVVSGAAVLRWSNRVKDIPASNVVEELIDSRFPDERMQRIFSNMSFEETYTYHPEKRNRK